MLQLVKVCKTYTGAGGSPVSALSEVSLQLEAGEFATVRGPSGCGKSTLLLTCGTLLSPDQGSISLNGESPYLLSADRRARFCANNIGFVFQQFHLIPYLNLRDNILAPTLALNNKEADKRADELIERFGLGERSRHTPASLSTGERQRVGLARALLNSPKLILADEPTGNLDNQNADIVLSALQAFAQNGGMVLMVTHNDSDRHAYTRSFVMENGGLQ